MNEKDKIRLEQIFKEIPDQTITINRYSSCENTVSFLSSQLENQTKGKLDIFYPFPWIEMTLCRFKGREISFYHEASENMIEINHCHIGRCGWKMNGDISTCLGEGDISVHSMVYCTDSLMSFPLEYYEGISIAIDLNKLHGNLPALLKEAGVDTDILYKKFCTDKIPFTFSVCEESEILFSALYNVPEFMRPAYYNLKAQELMLFLMQIDAIHKKRLNQYQSQQTEIIKEIHALLVKDLSKRFTIDELAKKYPINTTTLKNVFKTVYGYPIATYMKIHRIKESARLLRETDYSISRIAAAVGYESQGKFTEAFKSVLQVLPTEYRKQYQFAK